MKSNELMIGDWVQYDDGNLSFPTKIRGINEADFEIEDINCASTTLILRQYIEPIPLTEEILLANGWKKTRCSSAYKENGVPFRIDIGDIAIWIGEEWDDYFPIFSVQYVHELQHALRLCGLNELADNFKIKGGDE